MEQKNTEEQLELYKMSDLLTKKLSEEKQHWITHSNAERKAGSDELEKQRVIEQAQLGELQRKYKKELENLKLDEKKFEEAVK